MSGGPILVTGAAGQVGFELVRALAPVGPVLATTRATLDLADLDAVRAVVRAAAPAAIVNAAAYTAVDRAESEPEAARRLNAVLPGVVAEEAARLGVPLVHYSTDYVFDGAEPAPRPVDAPTGPLNVYGRTKLAGEEAVRAVGGRWLVLRTSWVYGARGANFLATMLRLAAERDVVRVVDDQHGAPTSSRFLADATARLLGAALRGDPAAPWGVHHLAAGGATSWHGFARAIFDGLAERGGRVPRLEAIATADFPTPARRPRHSVLDTSSVRAASGLHVPDWRVLLALVLDERLGPVPAAAAVR